MSQGRPSADDGGPMQPLLRGSLSLRFATLLSLALLPLGIIAVWQTARLERELVEVDSLNLTALTASVAATEREAIVSAFGAAMGLAGVIPEIAGDAAQCRTVFARLVAASQGTFSSAGFIPLSGRVTCSSIDETIEMAGTPEFAELSKTWTREVNVNLYDPEARRSVIVVSQPVFAPREEPLGHLWVSIPHDRLRTDVSEIVGAHEVDLFTVNRDGEVLTASGGLEEAAAHLPADRSPAELIDGPDRFVGRNGQGERRVFAVAPIVEDTVFAVGSWPLRGGTGGSFLPAGLASAALFPLLMWLASLLMVLVAVERLVVRHIRQIAEQMRRFGRQRELPTPREHGVIPSEVAVIEAEFGALASQLLQDEAELMDALHDKDVLLKEVHHRVKNNLQMISSIINLQMRRTSRPSTSVALASVNRRVSSMAAVHRTLYETDKLGQVRADQLLRDVATPLTDLAQPGAARPQVSFALDPITLYPDQAVPVALLTVEAITNALKYVGPDRNGDTRLRIALTDLSGTGVRLTVESTIDPDRPAGEDGTGEEVESTGLGRQLITAFARQLEAEVDIDEREDRYILSVSFSAQPFRAEDAPPAG